ncbi:cupin domain-containing protein [Candidatus Peribacteria bacterium]|nr:MAG: cupin domain-containing protein [Candidatus Peribacteria bacterium]
MKGFHANIETKTLGNDHFRHVLYTAEHSQLVVMSLQPGEEIGMEVHEENDQFFRCEKGQGTCVIDDNEYEIRDGSGFIIPAGARHNLINTSATDAMKLYTIYSPPHHKDGVIHQTKKDAETSEEEFEGKTTE